MRRLSWMMNGRDKMASGLTLAGLTLTSLLLSGSASAATLQVGAGKTYATPCQAQLAARDGDTIEIDAAVYADTCAWTQNNLVLRGVGGRPIIDGATLTKLAWNKALWVMVGTNNTVENIEFRNASITPDLGANGAGIRMDAATLTVRFCTFTHNQNGILTSNQSTLTGMLMVEYSEFGFNGTGDAGYTHNIYVGHLGTLIFRYNYSHDAVQSGQLLKTRAAVNYVLYNRFTDEKSDTGYELGIPNGGTSYVIGNVFEQSPNGANGTFLEYLSEGTNSLNPGHDLYVVNNTFDNERTAGATFVMVNSAASRAVVQNNIFYGPGTAISGTATAVSNLATTDASNFSNLSRYDYHLTATSPAIDMGTALPVDVTYALTPIAQYLHPTCAEVRRADGPLDIGAFEYGGAGQDYQCSAALAYGKKWDFTSASPLENWKVTGGTSTLSSGYLTLTSSSTDPQLASTPLNLNAADYGTLLISMKNSTTSSSGQLYFQTQGDSSWSTTRSVTFKTVASDPSYTLYTLNVGSNPWWQGTISRLRLDPTNTTGTVSIDFIYVVNRP